MIALFKITIILVAVFVTSACSLDVQILGKKTSASVGLPSVSAIKGVFPLGQAPFMENVKPKFAKTPGGKFVGVASFDLKAYVFAHDGKPLQTIVLSTGSSASYLITGLGVDGSDNIFIAIDDQTTATRRQYIRKFDINGNDLGIWKELLDENGMFPSPRTIYFDSNGDVYIGMNYLNQVRKYDSSGNQLMAYGDGTQSSTDGSINSLQSFAVDSSGYVYTVDAWTDRLQKFKPDGTYDSQTTWPRQLTSSTVSHLLLLQNGSFLTTESVGNSSNFVSFDMTGSLIYTDDGTGGGNTAFSGNYSDITEDGANFYIVNHSLTRVYNKITGAFVESFTATLAYPTGVVRDKDQNTYVSTPSGIKRFDPTGTNDLTFASGDGYFYGLAVDSVGNIYAPDFTTGKVFKYKPDGTIDTTYTISGTMLGGIAVDKDDVVYVAGYTTGVIYKMSSSLVPLGTLAGGVITNPLSVAAAGDGSLIVTDFDAGTNAFLGLKKITQSNSVVWSVGPGAAGNLAMGYFTAVDEDDNVYVTDAASSMVAKYDSDGAFMMSFGSAGVNLGQFSQPIGITVDIFGNIYVADSANNRVQKFDSAGAIQTE